MSFSDVVEAIKTLSLVNRDEVLGTREAVQSAILILKK
jgi:hypothetical protein